MIDFEIKKGDLQPDMTIVCTDADVPVDLTQALDIRIIGVYGSELEPLFDKSVSGTADGEVVCVWDAGDTDTAGTIYVEVEVMWANNEPQTFPPKGYLQVRVYQDLG